jgi:hypothetical protein
MPTANRPSPLHRALAASAIATLTTLWFTWGLYRFGPSGPDFDQLWYAARFTLQGRNPYQLIGPGRAVDQPWPLYYPLASILPALVVSWLSLTAARVCYTFLLAWAFAYLITRDGWHRLSSVMSGAWLSAMALLQWSPLAACAIVTPLAFGWMVAGKPTLGLANLAAARNRRELIQLIAWASALTLLSFAILPGWLAEWTAALSSASHIRPFIARPFGFLLLLAVFRWRRPEARWLAAIAIVPSSFGVADSLILFAFPHSFREGLVLALLTHAASFYVAFGLPTTGFDAVIARSTQAVLLFVLLPALAVVLKRPNTSEGVP